jgi:anti-sigma B factor antagonist
VAAQDTHGRAHEPEHEVSAVRRPGIFVARMSEATPATDTATEFRLRVERPSGDSAVVAVAGDADLHSGPELRERLTGLMDEGVTWLVLDLSETTFVDSMALGVLLGCVKRLRATGGRLDVVVPRPDIRRIFEITMLDRVFDLHMTLEQALDGRVDGRGPA